MNTVQSLERGLRILDALTEAAEDPMRRGRGVPLQVLADELGVHKSSALRLVNTLVAAGYAAPATNGSGYRLGPVLRRDAMASIDAVRLKRAARPFLEELVDRTGECAHIAVAHSGRALVLDDVETTQPLRVVPVSGRHVALHCTSAGKALLAFGLAEIPPTLPRRTVRTITSRAALAEHLAATRNAGYAYDDEENDTNTRCISAPVYGPGGTPIGCIGIDAPSVRLTTERVPDAAAHVVAIARRLSEALGRARTA